ncbi:hypothetical protein [Escherichia phage vB_EcoM_JNE01]|nr:hypothetical protein [Escherichia phage vB_EcoM_JNE01]
MIKDIDKVLFVLKGIVTLYRDITNMQSTFGLKDMETEYTHLEYLKSSLCTEDSEYSIHPVLVEPFQGTGFGIFDKNMELISMFRVMDGLINRTVLYSTWANINPKYPTIKAFDGSQKEITVDVDENMTEEEHFQTLMFRQMPEYKHMIDAINYTKEILPALEVNKFMHPVDYNHLNLDLSNTHFSEKVLQCIQNDTKFDFLKILKENPRTDFFKEYNNSFSTGDTSWWK